MAAEMGSTRSLAGMEKSDVSWLRPQPAVAVPPQALGRVSEVMVLDSQCGVLVHKRSLQNLPYRKAQQLFAKHMRANGQKRLNPYFRDGNIDFFYLSKNDIFLIAVHPSPDSDTTIAIVIYLDFLQRLYDILKECLGIVNEPYLSANQMLVFEILDEVTNLGYGFISSYNEIRPNLTFDPICPKVPQQDDLASRFFGINIMDKTGLNASSSEPKNKAPNSAYINIVEGLSAVLGPDGEVRSCELWGKLTLISTLERPAPIGIELNSDLVIRTSGQAEGQVAGATHIENPSFHSCVDSSQLVSKKILRVLPPSDQTRLMVYTLSDMACIRIPVVILPTLLDIQGSRDKEFSLRLINQAESFATASYIRVKVKLPTVITSVSTTQSLERQSTQFDAAEKSVEWELKKCLGGSEENITFRLVNHSNKPIDLADIGPISVTFNLTHFSASGLVVRNAKVEGHPKSASSSLEPQCFFGVSTKAASYIVKTSAHSGAASPT